MVNKYLVIVVAIILVASGIVLASEKGSEAGMHHDEGELRTVVGEVIDVSCYVAHGSRGEGHKDCAIACLEVGQPGGILEEKTGDIYISISDDHVISPNKKLIPYAAQIVEVKGTVSEKGGIKTIDIKEIKESKNITSKDSMVEKGSHSMRDKGSKKGSGY